MNWKPITKIVSCLLTLFLLGGACGYAIAGRASKSRLPGGRGSWAERWMERRIAEDAEFVGLTPEQQTELRPLYDRLVAEFNAIQQEASEKVGRSVKRMNRDILERLTPEQQQAYRALTKERTSRSQAKQGK
jgi:hypothetical protein